MGKASRSSYKKHRWSGGGKRKKISAGIKRYYGHEASRAAVWRKKEVTSLEDELPSENVISSASNSPTQLRTYERKKPMLQVEATFTENNSNTPVERPNSYPIKINWPVADPTTEDHQLLVETAPSETLSELTGYRVVDIKHVLRWAFSMENHKQNCIGSNIDLVMETKIGFHSVFVFKCSMCGKIWKQTNEETKQVNKAFVWGAVTAGSYYSAAAHVTSCMDIPSMSANMFRSIEKDLGNIWQEHLTEEIIKAGAEEKAIAIEKGHVNVDGVPYITVYADGASGIACIIGKETKKCLFLGVRNKYCYQCQYSERNNMDPKEHICSKNFTGPPTAMETDIVVEGFKKSEEMHGLQYLFFIGDSDSSVFANLRKNVSYGPKITKFECKSHVIKNYTSALYKLIGDEMC